MMRDIEKYSYDYNEDLDFEQILVKYRQKNILRKLSSVKNPRVLEIGVGAQPLLSSVRKHMIEIESWTIVEPAKIFINMLEGHKLSNCEVIHDFYPCDLGQRKFDVIICSGLLHEIPDPESILMEVFSSLDHNGIFIANVPNALSLHRQLALEMGLINSLYDLSERNKKLQQHKVFDIISFRELIASAGLSIVEEGGYFLKPLDHKNMHIISDISNRIHDALYYLGEKYPELASEIYIVSKRPESDV